MYHNQRSNTTDGVRTQSLANYTGTNGPTAPTVGRQVQSRKADPSSTARADKYPIPSFFDYRTKPRDYDVS